MQIQRYTHHGAEVAVRADLKGKHREFCLCWSCARFRPDNREANCRIANDLYANCVKHSVVTPVFECPQYDGPSTK